MKTTMKMTMVTRMRVTMVPLLITAVVASCRCHRVGRSLPIPPPDDRTTITPTSARRRGTDLSEQQRNLEQLEQLNLEAETDAIESAPVSTAPTELEFPSEDAPESAPVVTLIEPTPSSTPAPLEEEEEEEQDEQEADGQPSPSSSSPSQEEEELLPEGWTELVDPTSGRPYYFRESDGTTSWDRPVDAAAAAAASQLDGPFAAAAPPVEAEGEPTSTEAAASDLPAIEGIVPEHNEQPVDTTEPESQQLLPDGWTEVVDPSSENVYYYHAESGETRWERPVVPARAPEVVEAAATRPTIDYCSSRTDSDSRRTNPSGTTTSG